MQDRVILVVEDEKNLGVTLTEFLNGLGYKTFLAQTATKAKELFETINPNVVLMDIGLPDGNGLELAKGWRNKRKNFVLLFLSALNDPDTKVEGLEIGAQDYITKPFALKELTLRLERIFNSTEHLKKTPKEISHGPLKIFFQEFEVEDAMGKRISIGQKECAILQFLYEKSPEVLTREDIIKNIWGEDKYPSNRTVDNYIVSLRKWSETDPDKHIEITSIRGVGYKLIINKEK